MPTAVVCRGRSIAGLEEKARGRNGGVATCMSRIEFSKGVVGGCGTTKSAAQRLTSAGVSVG